MRKTTLATFGDNVLDFQLPDCWEKLTQEQLRYVCYAMSHFEAAEAKAYIFIRLLAIRVYRKVADGWICAVTLESKQKVRFFLWNYQIQCFLKVLDFLDAPAKSPVCLSQIGELRAVNVLLRGVPFLTTYELRIIIKDICKRMTSAKYKVWLKYCMWIRTAIIR